MRPVTRRLLLAGCSLLLLAGCDSSVRQWTENLPLPWLQSSSASSMISFDLRSSASSSALPLPDEPTFADEVASGSGASSSAAPRALSGALIERTLSGGILEVGIPTAPMLRVYTHPSCAYCREFEEEQLERLLSDFVETGDLRIQTMIVPLKKYPSSTLQASALVCAAERGKGSDMLRALFDAETLDAKSLPRITKALALDTTFTDCVASPKTAGTVAWQAALAANDQVTLVPTFAIGKERQTGLPAYPDLRGWIDAWLNGPRG
jgi:protein-disulfide isomerase